MLWDHYKKPKGKVPEASPPAVSFTDSLLNRTQELFTTEALVSQIAEVGALRVWQHDKGKPYDVTIKLKLPDGRSEVECKASSANLATALWEALRKAKIMSNLEM